MSNTTSQAASPALRWAVVAAIAGVAFFASYMFAVATGGSSSATTSSSGVPTAAVGSAGGSSGSSAGGGGCCGGGATGPKTSKSAEVSGDVQKITVDLSKGYYDPSTIELKAGVPAEITFGQGAGCLGAVQSQDLNFYEDLSSGSKTVKLGALQPGTYSFTCGMGMVNGSIVVK